MHAPVPFKSWPLHEKLALHLQRLFQRSEDRDGDLNQLFWTVDMAGDSAYLTERMPQLYTLKWREAILEIFSEANESLDVLLGPFRDLRRADEKEIEAQLPNIERVLCRIAKS